MALEAFTDETSGQWAEQMLRWLGSDKDGPEKRKQALQLEQESGPKSPYGVMQEPRWPRIFPGL